MLSRVRNDSRKVLRSSSIGLCWGVASWALWAMGCDGSVAPSDGGMEPARVRPRFELAADPMPFGAIPWPDDLYLDSSGRVALGAVPSEERARADFPPAIRETLRDLDGFSALAPVFFYFPAGSVDPSSLPATPSASVLEDSAVFLVDADPASPSAFRGRVPVLAHWSPELGQLALRPHDGHPLVPGRRYAAVVTTALRDVQGEPIGPDPRFASIRDAAARPADDPVEAEAWDLYTPVLASLDSNGVARERVAGLAVFTVQRVAPDLRDARAIVREGEVAPVQIDAIVPAGPELDALLGVPERDEPGLDVPGGVAHSSIGWVVQGRFRSPSFLAPEAFVHGRFRRDAEGRLVVQRTEEVPFTLVLPVGDGARLPVALFQHGLGAERSEVFSVADVLAAAGWATLAIDIPFHGMRAAGAGVDTRHRFGASEGPDGFGDRTGMEIYVDYFGIFDDRGELPSFHPLYVRDVLRQSVVDLFGAVRVIREGDWSAVREAGPASLAFGPAPLAFVGVSLGGIVGTVFVATEPDIGVAALEVTGGDLGRIVEGSANFSNIFLSLLLPRLGIDPSDVEARVYPPSFHPELALYQTLLDGGDSMAFAPLLRDRSVDLLFQMAEHDELVPNRATEALVRAADGQIVDADPVHTDLDRVSAPLTGNVEAGGRRVTRGLTRFAPATHGLVSRRSDAHRYVHPPEPPFAPTADRPVDNPIDQALEQIVYFLESWRSGAAEIARP